MILSKEDLKNFLRNYKDISTILKEMYSNEYNGFIIVDGKFYIIDSVGQYNLVDMKKFLSYFVENIF